MSSPDEARSATQPSDVDWSAFYERLHAFVRSRVRGTADADDLVQLILERAMSRSAGASIESAAGWLFGIARNAIADHYRAQARALIDEADTLEASAPLGGAEDERNAVVACMEPLLAALPSSTATLLRWADMEERSMQFIAGELGISLTAAKSRVQRARKEFMKVTRECCAITVDARGRVTDLTPKRTSRTPEAARASCCSTDTKDCS